MNDQSTLRTLLTLLLIATLALNCKKLDAPDIKPAASVKGDYKGTAANKANSSDKKALTISITSSDNPIAGTYTFAGIPGKVSGSALGLIFTLTLQPDAPGNTRYTFSAVADDNDTSLTGTMTGVESTTTVVYDVVVNK